MKKFRLSLPLILSAMALAVIGFIYFSDHPKRTYRVACGEENGAYLTFAKGLKGALSKKQNSLELTLEKSSGSLENLERLKKGTTDFALIQNGIRSDCPVSVVAQLYAEVVHILIPRDSKISGLEKLRDQRLCTGLPESGTRPVAHQLLSHYGISKGNFTELPLSPQEAANALLRGEADALFLVTGLRAPIIEELLATGKVRFLSLGTPTEPGNIAHGIHEHYPHLLPFIIPRHAYATQSHVSPALPARPVSALSVSSLLVCQKELPESVIQRITRSIFANRDHLLQSSPDSRHIRELTESDVFPYPVHPGAEAYYRRKDPAFLVKYADVLALLLTAAVTAIGMFSALRRWTEAGRKRRIDTYYENANEIIETLHSQNEIDLNDVELKLRLLNRKAFRDLVNEKLKADESFRIFQTIFDNGLSEIQWRRDHTGSHSAKKA